MSCFWGCRWSEWSNVLRRQMVYDIGGQAINGVESYQIRTCARCNVTESREV